MAIQVFTWLSKRGSQINETCKQNWTSYYLAQFLRFVHVASVRPGTLKVRDINCPPSLLIKYITSSSSTTSVSLLRLNVFNCWQPSAIRRTAFPLTPCWKENISFTLTKTALTVVLITEHYTYSCIKLMYNKEVCYPHFPFCLPYLHKAGNVHIK